MKFWFGGVRASLPARNFKSSILNKLTLAGRDAHTSTEKHIPILLESNFAWVLSIEKVLKAVDNLYLLLKRAKSQCQDLLSRSKGLSR